MRTAGWPDPSTVARLMAVGSWMDWSALARSSKAPKRWSASAWSLSVACCMVLILPRRPRAALRGFRAAAAACLAAILFLQVALAQADVERCDLDELVVLDELQG